MIASDYSQIDEVHKEVLRKIREEGPDAGMAFYRKNKGVYDSFGELADSTSLNDEDKTFLESRNCPVRLELLSKRREITEAIREQAGDISIRL